MAASANFPDYVAKIRTIRDVVAFDPDDPPGEVTWSWLERNHRHHNVGIPPALFESDLLPESDTFVVLSYPTTAIQELIDELSETHPRWVVETLFLGSAYVTPVLIHPSGLGEIQPYTLWDLYPEVEMDEEQLRRHVRILGYGTVDFHGSMVESGYEAVCDRAIPAERERRRRETKADGTDRCWRLFDGEGGSGTADRWVGGYFDALSLLTESAMAMLESRPEASIVLGVVGGLLMDIES